MGKNLPIGGRVPIIAIKKRENANQHKVLLHFRTWSLVRVRLRVGLGYIVIFIKVRGKSDFHSFDKVCSR